MPGQARRARCSPGPREPRVRGTPRWVGCARRSPPRRASRGTTALGGALRDPPQTKLTKENFMVHRETIGCILRSARRCASGVTPRSRSPRGRSRDCQRKRPAHSRSSLRPPHGAVSPPAAPSPGAHLSSGGCGSCCSCRGSPPRGGGRAPPPPRSAAAAKCRAAPGTGIYRWAAAGGGKRRAEPLRGAPPPRAEPAAFPPPGRGEPAGSRRGRAGEDEDEDADAAAPFRSPAAATRHRPLPAAPSEEHLRLPAGHRRAPLGTVAPGPCPGPAAAAPAKPPALLPPAAAAAAQARPWPLPGPCRGRCRCPVGALSGREPAAAAALPGAQLRRWISPLPVELSPPRCGQPHGERCAGGRALPRAGT